MVGAVLEPQHPPVLSPTGEVLYLIVQQIAHAHGGRVEVRSTPEEGSTFTVRLPRSAPSC